MSVHRYIAYRLVCVWAFLQTNFFKLLYEARYASHELEPWLMYMLGGYGRWNRVRTFAVPGMKAHDEILSEIRPSARINRHVHELRYHEGTILNRIGVLFKAAPIEIDMISLDKSANKDRMVALQTAEADGVGGAPAALVFAWVSSLRHGTGPRHSAPSVFCWFIRSLCLASRFNGPLQLAPANPKPKACYAGHWRWCGAFVWGGQYLQGRTAAA